MAPLATNGITPSDDFPAEQYDAVHHTVTERWSEHSRYDHYAGSWNALAYRYHDAVEAGLRFNQSILEHGPTPQSQERHGQEKDLYGFFTNGLSAIESSFYAAFAIGSFISPESFPLETAKDQQRISPTLTRDAYLRTFPGSTIIHTFDNLLADEAYRALREIRNILTHRTAPGRRMYVGLGEDDAPAVEWKLNNIVLDDHLVPNQQSELARMVSSVVAAMSVFIREN